MTTGRTVSKFQRLYVDGYDLSGYARSIGDLSCVFDTGIDDPMNAALKGSWTGQATIGCGTMNALFDNTATTGIHALMSSPSGMRNVLVAHGIQAAPANNDPAFCGQFPELDYKAAPGENPVALTIAFGGADARGVSLLYAQPFGVLLHALGAETAANTATGLDEGAQTTKGGYMMYQVTAAAGTGNITATIKVQDADTNLDGSFGDLLSSGVINCGSGGVAVPTSNVVALATNATVKRYVRFQISFTLATSVTFALAWVRNYI